MGKIRQLDEKVSNMIAAGEVVERPAGLVKELIDNSIDAESKKIEIDVIDGGLTKISVIDDGYGMDKEDAVMAFSRHATSKIHSQDDLWKIKTLGFRGEALPSIASVSNTTLITSDGKQHTRVVVNYGEMRTIETFPCNQGTSITVDGLFFHTPARLKHMKSGAYENALIQDIIYRFAFSHPEISFRFTSNDRLALQTSGNGKLLDVIYQCIGKDAYENAVEVAFEDFDYKVKGYIIKPNITRSNRNYIFLSVNGRMVKPYRLQKAVLDGYQDVIVKDRYPIVVLDIEMDSQLVDVNVHPSKWEIRLSKQNQLEQLLTTQIYQILHQTMLAPTSKVLETTRVEKPQLEIPNVDTTPKKVEKIDTKDSNPYVPQQPTIQYQSTSSVSQLNQAWVENVFSKPLEQPQMASQIPEMKVIGQLHQKLILCSVDQGLAVLDQHACQERVHYEEILQAIEHSHVIDLLVPIQLHASQALILRVDELNCMTQSMLIQFEPFGNDCLVVRKVPTWLKDVDEVQFLQDLLDYFAEQKTIQYELLQKKKIATMACHRSIRFNRTLSMQEMEKVVQELRQCQNPYHCPHGRPTFIIIEEKDLMKEFLR